MSRRSRVLLCEVLAAASLLAGAEATPPAAAQSLSPVKREQLCVTLGNLLDIPDRRLEIFDPELRATLRRQTRQLLEASFEFLGPTKELEPLGSGKIREQFGFKLRAANPCNLVYVMWRFKEYPKPGSPGTTLGPLLSVQVKRNPGRQTSAQCGNEGYTTVATRNIAAPVPGAKHKIRASMTDSRVGTSVSIRVDDQPEWRVNIDAALLGFDGPAGVRSDNAHLKFKLLAPPPTGPTLVCSGDGD